MCCLMRTCASRGCLQREEARVGRVLVVDRTLTRDFHDLLFNETITDSAGKNDTSGRCRLVLVPASVKANEYRLQYDGSKYTVPYDMQDVDCGIC